MRARLTCLLATAAILVSMTGASMAVVSSEQAREANANNRVDTQKQAPTGDDANSRLGQTSGSGTTGSELGEHPDVSDAKGAGESSSVGKSR